MGHFDRLKTAWLEYRASVASLNATKKVFREKMEPHKRLWVMQGHAYAKGAVDHLIDRLIWFLIILFVFLTLTGQFERDDTDSPTQRSNMELLTDHGTGCQYLHRNGALTPRLDANGNQVCPQPSSERKAG